MVDQKFLKELCRDWYYQKARKMLQSTSDLGYCIMCLTSGSAWGTTTSYLLIRGEGKYYGVFRRWDQGSVEQQIELFWGSTDQSVLKFEIEEYLVDFPTELGNQLWETLKTINVKAHVENFYYGMDGHFDELEINRAGFGDSRYSWWVEAPPEWRPLGDLASTLQQEIQTLVRAEYHDPNDDKSLWI